jgi:hypothetical protein
VLLYFSLGTNRQAAHQNVREKEKASFCLQFKNLCNTIDRIGVLTIVVLQLQHTYIEKKMTLEV